MKAVTVHGIALVLMMLFALQTWTRDESGSNDDRERVATVWELRPDDLRSITYRRAGRRTVIEQRDEQGGSHLWGMQYMKRDSAPETVEEFPIGQEGEDLWERIANFTALRDLGELDETRKEEYELLETERQLSVSLRDTSRTLEIGGAVYGSGQRYAFDPASDRGFVLTDDVIRTLESGMGAIRLRTLHRYEPDDVASVAVRGSAGERVMTRLSASSSDDTWAPPDSPGQPDQTFTNFMGHVEALSFGQFKSAVSVDTLEFMFRIDYANEAEEPLGYLEMYRIAGRDPDTWEYYLRTETTRIAALAHRTLAERVDRGLADIF